VGGTAGGCPPAAAIDPSATPGTPTRGDRDGDGVANKADADRDNDGVLNRDDNCPNKAGDVGGCPPQVAADPRPAAADDLDSDGIPDNADVDRDGDSFWNRVDGCPARFGTDGGCPAPVPPPVPVPAPDPTPAPAPPPPPATEPPATDTTPTTTTTGP
jgi:hypothetical protein